MRHADCCPRLHRPALTEGSAQVHRPLVRRRPARRVQGDRDDDTLTSINDLASLIEEQQGKLAEAIPLFTEELEGYVALHGIDPEETRDAAEHLAGVGC